mmetsp:Transcript_16220/g.43695  ORF Transcript_16220/g.43695 Transcript_16220/m.43695 type:complete len:200 (-) Transcript_16220:860-1459(-)
MRARPASSWTTSTEWHCQRLLGQWRTRRARATSWTPPSSRGRAKCAPTCAAGHVALRSNGLRSTARASADTSPVLSLNCACKTSSSLCAKVVAATLWHTRANISRPTPRRTSRSCNVPWPRRPSRRPPRPRQRIRRSLLRRRGWPWRTCSCGNTGRSTARRAKRRLCSRSAPDSPRSVHRRVTRARTRRSDRETTLSCW